MFNLGLATKPAIRPKSAKEMIREIVAWMQDTSPEERTRFLLLMRAVIVAAPEVKQ